MKAIVVLRVSTTSQQVDDQRDELVRFAKECGYDEKDLVFVEAIGASAIKLDQKYMDMANRIKDLIIEGGIDCVFVWEISRLGRNEVILMDFKEFFIKHKIQFICKNPSLRLLNDDGMVNTGTELAFSLFATMSKQEMQEKKARFKRSKIAMAQRGQYIGGNTRRYGYKVGDGGFFIEDENEGKVVRMVFDLYSTGKYSSYSLSRELNERGVDIDARKITRILQSTAYVGDAVCEFGLHYPQIISREVFDRCAEIRQGNVIDMKRGKRIILCAKLVKCPVCGGTCTSNSRRFLCANHGHGGKCTNGLSIKQEVVNDIAWRVAHQLHLDYLMELNETKKEEYRKELEITDEKIAEAQRKMEAFTEKKERVVESYLEGLISRENRDLRLSKIRDDIRLHMEYLSGIQAKREALVRLLDGNKKSEYDAFISSLDQMENESMYDIIHKHIMSIVFEHESFGIRDKRCSRPNAVKLTVNDVYGGEHLFMYFPKYYKGHNLYISDGERWIGDRVTKID